MNDSVVNHYRRDARRKKPRRRPRRGEHPRAMEFDLCAGSRARIRWTHLAGNGLGVASASIRPIDHCTISSHIF